MLAVNQEYLMMNLIKQAALLTHLDELGWKTLAVPLSWWVICLNWQLFFGSVHYIVFFLKNYF